MEKSFLRYDPIVFVIGDGYDIRFVTREKGKAGVRIGNEVFWDASNGVIRSETNVHSVRIPQKNLDRAGSYTVLYCSYPHREAYFPKHTPEEEVTYRFFPVRKGEEIRAFWISDTHGHSRLPVEAGKFFGDSLDLLILGGDINESENEEQILLTYQISEELTGGSRPVLFVRGNHDLRGRLAELLPEYVPTDDGKVFYTFRLGSLWGVILDAGEDKEDGSEEYGGTAAFIPFRKEEVKFLQKVACRAKEEYEAEGVETRLALCHLPFTDYTDPSPVFDQSWSRKEYNEMTGLLNGMGVQAMLSGHMHKSYIHTGKEQVAVDVPPAFPLLVSGFPGGEECYIGMALDIGKRSIRVRFVNHNREIGRAHV